MFKIVIFFFLIFFQVGATLAEIIKNIDVKGNERVSKETIINFSDLKIGDDISETMLNNSLKDLYDSKFFEDVNLKLNNGTLIISVKELPIIQEIIINGVKANKNKEKIKETISLKEKNPFNQNVILNDVNTILNIFKQSGFYFASVESKIEKNDNDTINVIFDIDEGEKASISKIKFIGDKKIKDRKLYSVITSEEDKIWKFISNKKYLNVERINSVSARSVALLGEDYHGLKPTMLVQEGNVVIKGQNLFEDKKNPGVKFTSPISGKIVEINRGERRTFLSMVIEKNINSTSEVSFESFQDISKLSKDLVIENLIESGVWTSFRTRPFSKIPKIQQNIHTYRKIMPHSQKNTMRKIQHCQSGRTEEQSTQAEWECQDSRAHQAGCCQGGGQSHRKRR